VVKPMLLTSGPLRPDSDKYAFELKWTTGAPLALLRAFASDEGR